MPEVEPPKDDLAFGRGSAGSSAREEASAQKCAFERPVTVHAATAETGDFPGREETGDGVAAGVEDASVQVHVESSQGLSGQDPQAHGDQRAVIIVEQGSGSGDATHALAPVPAGAPNLDEL